MAWFATSPRDPADPRWPLPDRDQVSLKAEDVPDARAKFLQASPSRPFGTPAPPVPDAEECGFSEDGQALEIVATEAPPPA